jgi:hypothetical protein
VLAVVAVVASMQLLIHHAVVAEELMLRRLMSLAFRALSLFKSALVEAAVPILAQLVVTALIPGLTALL